MQNTETIASEGTGEATATADAGGSATGQVAPEGTQGQEANAGGEQSLSESSREEGTGQRHRKFRSPQERIYELKQSMREREEYWNSELGTVKQQLAEFQKKFGVGQEQKPSRTFYEAPEDTLRDVTRENLREFKEELLSELRQTETERARTIETRQEASEAAKFIRSQAGLTNDDIMEISGIIREEPIMESMTPMQRAEYALFIYQKSRGVTDKTAMKQKAAGVSGSGVSPQGPKVWTESEMQSELEKLGNPKNWSNETRQKARALEQEFMSAYKTNRVKK